MHYLLAFFLILFSGSATHAETLGSRLRSDRQANLRSDIIERAAPATIQDFANLAPASGGAEPMRRKTMRADRHANLRSDVIARAAPTTIQDFANLAPASGGVEPIRRNALRSDRQVTLRSDWSIYPTGN